MAILGDRYGTGANHGQLLYLDSNQDNSHRGAAEVMDLLKRYFVDEVSLAHINQTSASVSLERERLGGAVGRQEEVLPAVSSVALVSRLPSCVRPLGSSLFNVPDRFPRGRDPDLPQQTDGSSCGVFMLAFAEALSRGVDPTQLSRVFRAGDCDDFRQQICADVMRGAAPGL